MTAKPESSLLKQLQTIWTPVFIGVTTFYGAIKINIKINLIIAQYGHITTEVEISFFTTCRLTMD